MAAQHFKDEVLINRKAKCYISPEIPARRSNVVQELSLVQAGDERADLLYYLDSMPAIQIRSSAG